ncbi:hypothetical protein [Streptomyces sp. NPDC059071]|uniref:hypothetical protein n=1 Tax=unclassified Streptomyces TaxID=2593676 RepID=UPI00365D4073
MASDPAYVDALAEELCARHTALLATAEDDLALLRGRLAIVTAWINDPTHDHAARTALADALGLPAPTQERKHHGH